MAKTTRGERLRIARRKHYKSARAAAIALDMPVATYGAHERAEAPGGRDYGPDEAKRYARRFKCEPEWLLTGRDTFGAGVDIDAVDAETQDEGNGTRSVRVKGYVGAGAEGHYYAVAQGDLDEVPAPDGSNDNTIALEIKGDSLGTFFDRWLVFYDEVRDPPTLDMIGWPCVVGLETGQILIKKLGRSRTPGRFTLLSQNADPILDAEVTWAAKVKHMKPRR